MSCEAYTPGAESFIQNVDCPYFPCHEGVEDKDFNCLFCYCPLYALGSECGGHFVFTTEGVKDCTPCNFPHHRKNYEMMLKRSFAVHEFIRKNEEQLKGEKS